jgi:hypothetical protein
MLIAAGMMFPISQAYAWDVTATPPTGPFIICKGETWSADFAAAITGGDIPQGTANCTVSHTTEWTGTDASNTGHVTKTFDTAGVHHGSVSAKVTYSYTQVKITDEPCLEGEAKSGSATVDVCVVDPGTVPTGVAGVNYIEHQVAPSGTDWGGTTPSHATLGITAYFDCTTKLWKCKITQADSDYNIFYHLIGTVQEASVADETITNYCKMMSDLNALGNVPNVEWYMASAVEAHERQHVSTWKMVQDDTFATAKATIEGLSVSHICSRTAAQAQALIEALPAYADAIMLMRDDNKSLWKILTNPDPNSRTDAAEHAVVDPMIASINAHALAQNWPACP